MSILVSKVWFRNENNALNNEREKAENTYENQKIVDVNETGSNSVSEKLDDSKNEDELDGDNKCLSDS